MANKIKIAGLVLFIIGAILIILSHFLGWNNINAVNFGSVTLMIVGLITYIAAYKKVIEE
jgi:membrane-bound ClpP family serine protease